LGEVLIRLGHRLAGDVVPMPDLSGSASRG
jgi:hypothetical protein